MANKKKKLTVDQEFQIMKLVLDKFLWLGFIVMGWGMYKSLAGTFTDGIWYLVTGAVLLFVFMIAIVREYEIIK